MYFEVEKCFCADACSTLGDTETHVLCVPRTGCVMTFSEVITRLMYSFLLLQNPTEPWPRLLFSPICSFSQYFLKFKLNLSLSKTLPASPVLLKGPLQSGASVPSKMVLKSHGCLSGIGMDVASVESKGAGFEILSTAVPWHLPVLSPGSCFSCQISAG